MNFEKSVYVIPTAAIAVTSLIAILFYGLTYNWTQTSDLIIYHIMDKCYYIIPGEAILAADLLISAAVVFVILMTITVGTNWVFSIIDLAKRNVIHPAKTGTACLILFGALGLALVADIFHNLAYIGLDYSFLNGIMPTTVMSNTCIICIFILALLTIIYWLFFLYRVYKAKEAVNESEVPDNN